MFARASQVWDALYRMMENEDRRVRFAAWPTIEDGGMPGDSEGLSVLERKLAQESDPKIIRFAQQIIGDALRERDQHEWERQRLAACHLASYAASATSAARTMWSSSATLTH